MKERSLQTGFRAELVSDSVFVAANATLLGEVSIGEESRVWFGAVVRGDTEAVDIGCRCNVQDLAVLHADPGFPCRLGNEVTVGHSAVVHGAIVESGALIGIRAVVLNGAKIGARALVGAGALVTEGMEIPAGHLALGVPAKVVRELTDVELQRLTRTAEHYVAAGQAYLESGDGA